MAIKKTSREEILQKAIILFKKRGYSNTSIANIAEECGLIKGSLYHHFKSKDEIGLESLKYIHEYFDKNVYQIAYDDTLNSKEKIKLFVKKVDDYFLNSEGGCLLGNLALEVSYENKEFKILIKEYFLAWENALFNIFKNKYTNDEARRLSRECVSLTQGAIMLMNLYNSKKDYLSVGEKIINLV
ncbi:TetR/AcrR family transcriptional regulator [Arcobacter sp. YIC-80]|uniref:TetR/AcrR family transcriptional regulator n=1 Tax=Arcobacter sp. YIC-80 TaxID=3376683 RepID=UPI00384D7416